MAALTEELERRAPDSAYVSLIADGPARFLYEKFGFAYTAAHDSIGMHRVMGSDCSWFAEFRFCCTFVVC